MDADGDFVVVWDSNPQDGDYYGVYGQRFNAAGFPRGSEFRINSYTTDDQLFSSIAMDSGGDFVVVWESQFGQDGSGHGIFGQRFNAAGVVQGPEFQVNTYTTGNEEGPSVAMDAQGNFVVAWTSAQWQDGGNEGIFAQRFNSAGVPQGGEFGVNSYTTGLQKQPSVAMDLDGDFVVAWKDAGYGLWSDITGRRFNAAGVAQDSELRVNSYTTEAQEVAVVAMDSDGDFVVVWQSTAQDGQSWGIYAQRYAENPAPPDFNSDRHADLLWHNGADGRNAVWLMDGAVRLGGGNLLSVGDLNWMVAGTGDLDGDGRTDIVWRNTSTGQNAAWLMDGATQVGGGNLLTVADSNWMVAGVGDLDGDGKVDLVWRNVADGRNAVWLMDGTARIGGGSLLTVADPNWTVAGIGDLDGDGKADIVWRNTGTGQNAAWLMDGATQVGGGNLLTVADTNWTVAGMGDLDSDGKADLVWRNTSTGQNAAWLMDATTRIGGGNLLTVGDSSWTVAEVGDLDGDGNDDLVWRHTGTGHNAVWLMDGATRIGGGPLITVGVDWYTEN